MTKRQDLYLQRRSRSEQSDQRQPNQAKNISHQPRASPNSTPLTSRIEFPTMTTIGNGPGTDRVPRPFPLSFRGCPDQPARPAFVPAELLLSSPLHGRCLKDVTA